MSSEKIDASYLKQLQSAYTVKADDLEYFVFTDVIRNQIYNKEKSPIILLYKDGSTKEISETFDLFNVANLVRPVEKYFVSYLKD